ncbi:MAG: hypothetical protein R8G01_12190 [Ilumatobacteraceae bacterium]|nr:hypothetical protein [Ilumatobacteraceae bacterium]
MRTITPRRMSATIAAVAAIALAGCGGSDSDSAADGAEPVADTGELVIDESAAGATAPAETPVAEPAGDADGSPDGPADDGTAATGESTDEEKALAFAECMRDEGVDWPDPSTSADGSVDLLGGQTLAQVAGSSPEATQAAADVCTPLIEGASFLPGGGSGTFDAETQDAFVEFAECLRDEGLEVSDPDFSSGGNPLVGLFGPGFDPNDLDNAAAIDACSGIFAGTPIGDAAGTGS